VALIKIELDPTIEEFREMAEKAPKTAGMTLDPELKAFSNSMMKRGLDPLTRIERAILREYLGWKLTNDLETP
jgi:hypothetical protein